MNTFAPQQGQQQSETEVVSGQVTGVITKGPDKWQVSVQPQGSQYTKNLWSKDAGLVGQMQSAVGQWFDFICGTSYWTNNEGKQVRSLWINGITAPGGAPAPVAAPAPLPQQQPMHPSVAAFQPTQYGTPAPQAQQQHVPQATAQQQAPPAVQIGGEERETRIMRQTAAKVAAQMLPYMAPEERNALGMMTVAEGWVRYFRTGPPPAQPMTSAEAWHSDPVGSDPGPEPGDLGPEWPS